jgi:hypothetical protein
MWSRQVSIHLRLSGSESLRLLESGAPCSARHCSRKATPNRPRRPGHRTLGLAARHGLGQGTSRRRFRGLIRRVGGRTTTGSNCTAMYCSWRCSQAEACSRVRTRRRVAGMQVSGRLARQQPAPVLTAGVSGPGLSCAYTNGSRQRMGRYGDLSPKAASLCPSILLHCRSASALLRCQTLKPHGADVEN